MPQVTTPRGVIEYREDGDPDGTPVVLVHGFPDGPSTWDAVVAALPAGLRVVRPSLRGVGGSSVHPEERSGQVAALATDLLDLFDALDLHDAVLVGHDWGSRAAHAVAAVAPERLRGLVGIATAYGPRTGLSTQQTLDDAAVAWYRWWLCTEVGEAAFRKTPSGLLVWSWDHWSSPDVIDPDDRQALLASFASDEFTDTVVHYYRHGAGEAPGNPRYADLQATLDAWPTIHVPTTFLVGDADACETVAAARDARSSFDGDFRLVELAGVGHFVQREVPAEVVAAVAERL